MGMLKNMGGKGVSDLRELRMTTSHWKMNMIIPKHTEKLEVRNQTVYGSIDYKTLKASVFGTRKGYC